MDNSNFCTHIFEYDPNKSSKNVASHGIDFEEAKALWKDTNLIEAPAITHAGEKRFMVIGSLRGKMWTGIITYRGESIRIISVRRSRIEEAAQYDAINHQMNERDCPSPSGVKTQTGIG